MSGGAKTVVPAEGLQEGPGGEARGDPRRERHKGTRKGRHTRTLRGGTQGHEEGGTRGTQGEEERVVHAYLQGLKVRVAFVKASTSAWGLGRAWHSAWRSRLGCKSAWGFARSEEGGSGLHGDLADEGPRSVRESPG